MTNPMTPEEKKLKPCPFCGSEPEISELRYANTKGLYGYILKCECGFNKRFEAVCWPEGEEAERLKETYEEAFAWWNRRSTAEAKRKGAV